MSFSLQVKYKAVQYQTGDVVAIRPDGFEYFEGDCLEKWLEAGRSLETWQHKFAIIYVQDEGMTGNEPEVQVLTERYSDDPNALLKRKHYIELPVLENNIHRVNIREKGQTSATWAEVQILIREHK